MSTAAPLHRPTDGGPSAICIAPDVRIALRAQPNPNKSSPQILFRAGGGRCADWGTDWGTAGLHWCILLVGFVCMDTCRRRPRRVQANEAMASPTFGTMGREGGGCRGVPVVQIKDIIGCGTGLGEDPKTPVTLWAAGGHQNSKNSELSDGCRFAIRLDMLVTHTSELPPIGVHSQVVSITRTVEAQWNITTAARGGGGGARSKFAVQADPPSRRDAVAHWGEPRGMTGTKQRLRPDKRWCSVAVPNVNCCRRPLRTERGAITGGSLHAIQRGMTGDMVRSPKRTARTRALPRLPKWTVRDATGHYSEASRSNELLSFSASELRRALRCYSETFPVEDYVPTSVAYAPTTARCAEHRHSPTTRPAADCSGLRGCVCVCVCLTHPTEISFVKMTRNGVGISKLRKPKRPGRRLWSGLLISLQRTQTRPHIGGVVVWT